MCLKNIMAKKMINIALLVLILPTFADESIFWGYTAILYSVAAVLFRVLAVIEFISQDRIQNLHISLIFVFGGSAIENNIILIPNNNQTIFAV